MFSKVNGMAAGNEKEFGKKRSKKRIRKIFFWVMMAMYLSWTPLVTLYIWSGTYLSREEMKTQYAAEIEAFDQKAIDYSLYLFRDVFDFEEIDDLKICNKIMYDMWSNIKGYGKPEVDPVGFSRLDIVSENGVGVCRNMADYMATVLDSQITNYFSNPRRIYVDMGSSGNNCILDIPREILTESSELSSREEEYEASRFLKKYAANHVIVAVDVNDYTSDVKFTLLIDPTNPGYGYLKNGKIVWINAAYDRQGNPVDSDLLSYKYKARADFEMNEKHGLNAKAIRNSYLLSKKAENYIWSHYDLSNQQRALEEIKLIDDKEYVGATYFHGAISDVLGNR